MTKIEAGFPLIFGLGMMYVDERLLWRMPTSKSLICLPLSIGKLSSKVHGSADEVRI